MVLYGCSSYHIVLIDGTKPFSPTFKLSKGNKAMPVSSIGVFDSNTTEIMWDVVNPIELSEITYGILPNGMKSGVSPKKLKINTPYSLACSYGDYGAIIQFMIIEKDEKLIAVMIDERST